MARAQPEMGYFEKDGNVSHGIVGLTEGRPITEAEARAISAAKRLNMPVLNEQQERDFGPEVVALISDLAAQHQAQIAALNAELANQRAIITDMLTPKAQA